MNMAANTTDTDNDSYYINLNLGFRIVVYIITCPVLVGNLLTIIIILKYKRLQNKPNALIFSLCCADFGVGIITFLVYGIKPEGGEKQSEVWAVIVAMTISLWYMSILHLLLIAIERYVAILHPLRYNSLITKKVIGLMITVAWIVAVCLFIAARVVAATGQQDEKSFQIFLPFIYVLKGIVLALLYIRVLREVSKQAKRIKDLTLSVEAKKDIQQIKATKLIGIIILAYFLSWMPVGFLNLLMVAKIVSGTTKIYEAFKHAFLLLGFCNSGLNNCIYAWKYTAFRKGYKSLLRLEKSE